MTNHQCRLLACLRVGADASPSWHLRDISTHTRFKILPGHIVDAGKIGEAAIVAAVRRERPLVVDRTLSRQYSTCLQVLLAVIFVVGIDLAHEARL